MTDTDRTLTQDEIDALGLSTYGNVLGEPWTVADLSFGQLAALVDAYRVGTLTTGGVAS